MAGSVTEAKIGVRLRIRPVRAEYEHVNAEHTQHGVDGTVAVAGRFDEHVRVDHTPRQRVGPAAGGQALAVQRPETRQRGEADPQPRIGRPAIGAEREPCRVQLLNIGDKGGPPRRAARRPGRGPGVDEEREVPFGEHVEQRAAPAVAGLVGDRACWQLEPGEPPVELLGEAGRVDFRQAGRGPAANGGPSSATPLW